MVTQARTSVTTVTALFVRRLKNATSATGRSLSVCAARDDRHQRVLARYPHEACLHWRGARGLEKNSLPSGGAGAEERDGNQSEPLAQRLLSAGATYRSDRRHR